MTIETIPGQVFVFSFSPFPHLLDEAHNADTAESCQQE